MIKGTLRWKRPPNSQGLQSFEESGDFAVRLAQLAAYLAHDDRRLVIDFVAYFPFRGQSTNALSADLIIDLRFVLEISNE